MKSKIKDLLIFVKDELWYGVMFDNIIYLIVGVIAAVATTLIDLLVIKDFWALAYAAVGGILTFATLKLSGDLYRIKGLWGWSLIAFAVLTLSTALIPIPDCLLLLGQHTFGCIIGLIVLLFLLWLVDYNYSWRISSLSKYILMIGLGGSLLAVCMFFFETTICA